MKLNYIFSFLSIACSVQSIALEKSSAEFDHLVDQLTIKDAHKVPGVVLTAVDQTGKTILHRTSGYSSIHQNATPIHDDSVFRLASSTKIFTAVAMLQCVERGQIGLDDSVMDILYELKNSSVINWHNGSTPEFTFTPLDRPITVRQLLSHTSGIGYDLIDPVLEAWRKANNAAFTTMGDEIIPLYDTPLLFQPGEGWVYGGGYDAAAELISRLNGGISLEEFMQKNIFKPLGLHSSTYFIHKHPALAERLVECTTRKDNGTLTYLKQNDYPAQARGGEGLYTTVPDFIALLSDLLQENPVLLQKDTVEELFSPQLHNKAEKSAFRNASSLYDPILGPLTTGLDVNHALGGVLVEQDSDLGPTNGTMSWAGGTSNVWFVNRQEGIAAFCSMQIMPSVDKEANKLMRAFIREAWRLHAK